VAKALNQSTPTIDDLFQILVGRDIPPFEAKELILQFLRRGKLPIDSHVEAGARKTRAMRQATPEELQAQQAGKSLDYLHEVVPAGGITEPVNPQCWDGGVFALAIRDGRLLVEPRCALDFPWPKYSFPVSNPVVIEAAIEEMWKTWKAAAGSKSEPISVSIVGPVELIQKHRDEEEIARELTRKETPPASAKPLTTKELVKAELAKMTVDEIPDEITKLAKLLQRRLGLTHWEHLRNEFRHWGYWPVPHKLLKKS
jgi:hypothetical protein